MLSIIVAVAKNNVIGKDNKLIWHISEDLKRFKSITSGNAMLMGRKTFESLPFVLPGRTHLVLSTKKDFSYHYHDFHKIIVFRFRQLYQEMYFQ